MVNLELTNGSFETDVLLSGSRKTVTVEGPYGVHDTIRYGLHSVAHDLAPKHPLVSSLKSVLCFKGSIIVPLAFPRE